MKYLVHLLQILIALNGSPWHGNWSVSSEYLSQPRTKRQSEFAWQDFLFGTVRNSVEGEQLLDYNFNKNLETLEKNYHQRSKETN